MKVLIVDDDLTSQQILYKFLDEYGECDIVGSGMEAIAAFDLAIQKNSPYDLVTLDIMLPAPDGQMLLSMIREKESKLGVPTALSAKIIMTTSLYDRQNVINAASNKCDAYLIKPIAGEKLHGVLTSIGFSKKALRKSASGS
jgi:two-component system, chemotaxis family, chemotaxis protein CheY